MVSTRHHPRAFPEPASPTSKSTRTTPAKSSSSRTKSPARTKSPGSPTVEIPGSETNDVASSNAVVKSASARSTRKRKSTGPAVLSSYTHAIDPIIISWLLISLPLVFWDTSYIFMRPSSMPGGRAHSPIWYPYALYGTVDYMYGWPAWNDGVGFTAAQGALNAVESACYIYYLYVLAKQARKGELFSVWRQEYWTGTTLIGGEGVARAVLICFASAVMTFSKTVLYWLNEYYSNFENIGHNNWSRLFWLWIIPNGAWIVASAYLIYVLGREIVSAMHLAGGSARNGKAD